MSLSQRVFESFWWLLWYAAQVPSKEGLVTLIVRVLSAGGLSAAKPCDVQPLN